jgi:hypothetical protein
MCQRRAAVLVAVDDPTARREQIDAAIGAHRQPARAQL